MTGFDDTSAGGPRAVGSGLNRGGGDNALGVVGFVCSLVGLCAGGVLSPIGLIISLFGLGSRPRGWAIAGVVLGLIGTCGVLPLLVAVFFLPIAVALLVAVGLAGALAALGGPTVEGYVDMTRIAAAAGLHREEHQVFPASLDGLGLDAEVLRDAHGNRYIYEVKDDGSAFRIHSAGADGVSGTGDDLWLGAANEWQSGDWTFGASPTGP